MTSPLRRVQTECGVALVIALMATTLMLTLGCALVLLSSSETVITANFRAAHEAAYAADAAMERALADLRNVPDWTTVLSGGAVLVPLTAPMLTDGPWCPDAVNPNRFDADLLRIRRVAVTLRVESAAASLRGPAGPLFARPGSSSGGEAFVPDQEIRFDVAPRNLNLER